MAGTYVKGVCAPAAIIWPPLAAAILIVALSLFSCSLSLLLLLPVPTLLLIRSNEQRTSVELPAIVPETSAAHATVYL